MYSPHSLSFYVVVYIEAHTHYAPWVKNHADMYYMSALGYGIIVSSIGGGGSVIIDLFFSSHLPDDLCNLQATEMRPRNNTQVPWLAKPPARRIKLLVNMHGIMNDPRGVPSRALELAPAVYGLYYTVYVGV